MRAALQVSYMILQRVSPVTHSIGNCLKRVIVIVASVLVFKNPMSQQNMIGAIPRTPINHADDLWPVDQRDDRCFWPAYHSERGAGDCHEYHASCPAGTGIALAGVFAYSQVKRGQGKTKVA